MFRYPVIARSGLATRQLRTNSTRFVNFDATLPYIQRCYFSENGNTFHLFNTYIFFK
ncbi:MAG: hypothetical protein L3J84_12830 [Gammaproteobacteria bacterium]|nr:hypothetical protein [Gammaproteobacteria bacterium]